jgi:CRISPR/Cas system-associated exonuclease Cas4 (RecB family)
VTTHYVEGTEKSQRLKVANTESAREKLKDLWRGRVDLMQSDSLCAPKPGQHCNWCDYSKKKGGPCVFGA